MHFLLKHKQVASIGVGVLVLIALGVFFVVAAQKNSNDNSPFSLVAGETPVWRFEGAYEATDALRTKAENTIKDLQQQLRDGSYSEYLLDVGIAGQYELLGQGKKSYEYLLKALRVNNTRALAYSNMGNLLQKVKAPRSALVAYEEALKRSDTVQNRILLITHLESFFPENTARIKKEYDEALTAHPNSTLLKNRAASVIQ